MGKANPKDSPFISFDPKNMPLLSDEFPCQDLEELTKQQAKNETGNKYYKSMNEINVTAKHRVFLL